MEKSEKKARFAPKVYGRWFVPISWEGWLIMLLIIAFIMAWAPLILGEEKDPWMMKLMLFLLFALVIAIAPIVILKKRMIGTLKWRRGKKDIDW